MSLHPKLDLSGLVKNEVVKWDDFIGENMTSLVVD